MFNDNSVVDPTKTVLRFNRSESSAMLENINVNRKVKKSEFKEAIDELELKLASLQREARDLNIPVIIVFEGWDAAGKGTLINELILPLDPRGFTVSSTLRPNEEETMRPFLWRFWTRTPAAGRIGIFDRSWYHQVISDRIEKNGKVAEFFRAYEDIRSFERQLADGGNVIIKLFLHITKKEQKKRFKKLQKNKSTSWRVTKDDLKRHKKYDQYLDAINDMLANTDSDYARWTVVEAHDQRFATLKIFNTVIAALESRVQRVRRDQKRKKSKPTIASALPDKLNVSILDKADLSRALEKPEYKKKLKAYQKEIRQLEHEIYVRRIPVVLVYEGWDAAGKGGNIRRLTQNLDPRGYEVVPIAAPNDIETAHHYLWRFWREIPKAGHITIFDRSWYGRVLVERVENFCTVSQWQRAYREINEMEQHLANYGTVVRKFWIQIDLDEQLRRFQAREKNPHKSWKITDEDWRNREKWDLYKPAVEEMLFRTSTPYAPWIVVESNCKRYARIKVLRTVCDAIRERLDEHS